VEGSGAVTIAGPWPRVMTFSLTAFLGAILLVIMGWILGNSHLPLWAKVTCLAVRGGVLIWGFARAWRVALRIDEHGLTIRNHLRTHRVSWPEVRCLSDHMLDPARGPQLWALCVVLRDGRRVTAEGTGMRVPVQAGTLAAIRQAAERHGIPADLTGSPKSQLPRARRAASQDGQHQ
jgi:Bacterial PH domain